VHKVYIKSFIKSILLYRRGVRGEEIAKGLYEKGFTNLYLTTGHSPETFPHLPWTAEGVLLSRRTFCRFGKAKGVRRIACPPEPLAKEGGEGTAVGVRWLFLRVKLRNDGSIRR